MEKTLVGYFDDRSEAERTQQDLLAQGFNYEEVDVVFRDEEQVSAQKEEPSLWDKMKASFGFADEDRLAYEEAARHGGALVTVHAEEDRIDLAAAIIEQHHPADLDERIESWRGAESGAGESAAARGPAQAGETRVPIVEEQVRAGKQAVRRGAVRIHTRVHEQPVEKQLTLEEERARVERRPASGEAAGEEAFQERTFEVEETGEEPVVAKEAKVVEEVVVGKEKEARQAEVRDTARRTEVDVERKEPPRKQP